MKTAGDLLAQAQSKIFSKTLNNVEAKALVKTSAKKMKYTKPDTNETTLGDVAAQGLVDTLVIRC